MNKKHLITIIGATAIGKTALSIKLAREFKTEILSCDSRQFYNEMSIGTAVPSEEELAQVPHHFIQDRSVFDNYSVGQFEKDAINKLDELFEKYDVLVMVGGSGLYINSVLKGLDQFPDIDPKIRKELQDRLQHDGIESLQLELKKRDSVTYEKIDLDNHQRVLRALEICIGTEKPYASFLTNKLAYRTFNPIKIGLHAERHILYKRINKRVDLMMANGLLEEARQLHPHKELNALQTVGYKELFPYFDGDYSLDFAISEIKKNTRRFAKRQATWFRKDQDIKWFNYQEDAAKIIEYIKELIK